jgi:hypothetical protein
VISRKLSDAEALEASLATHLTRLKLEPADEAAAFRNLLKGGKTPEAIAALFAAPLRFVQQRLAIGALPAPILKALRDKEIDVNIAEAFTLTGDAKLQAKLFAEMSKGGRLNDWSVRQQIIGKAINATDGKARFVGDKAYLAQGGSIAVDLFGKDRWYEDGKLVGKLFSEKLAQTEKRLKADGWSFVIVATDHTYSYESWSRLEPKGKPLPAAKARAQALDAEIGTLKEAIKKIDALRGRGIDEDADGDLDDRRIDLDERLEALKAERATMSVAVFTPEQMQKSGAVILVGHQVEIRLGMIDPKVERQAQKAREKAKAKKAKTVGKSVAGAGVSGPGAPVAAVEEPDFTGDLKTELAQHMSEALKQAIADRPQAAHYALIATLVMDALEDHVEGGSPIAIALTRDPRDWRNRPDGDKQVSAFGELLAAALKPLIPAPPADKAERKRWEKSDGDVLRLADVIAKLEGLEHTELLRLQALLVARALKIDMNFMADPDVSTMIQRFDPEVGKVWMPGEAFFQKLKKPDLVAALEEAAVVDIPRSGGKAQLVALSLAKLPALGWLPKPLRAPNYAGPGSQCLGRRAGRERRRCRRRPGPGA